MSIFLSLARLRTKVLNSLYEGRIRQYVRQGMTRQQAIQQVSCDDNECYLQG